jgi:ATP-binding cassette subfamily B protein
MKEHQAPSTADVFRFLKNHYLRMPWLVGGIYLCMSLAPLTSITTPLAYKWLIDTAATAIEGRSFELILWPILAVVGLSMTHHLLTRAARFLNCFTTPRVHASIAAESVAAVHSFETEWHTNIFAGSIVTAIKRGRSAAHRIFDIAYYDFWPAIIVMVGSIIIAWQKSHVIAGMLVIYAICFITFSIVLSFKYIAPKNRIFADEDSRLGGIVADSVTGYAAVKASGAEAYEYERVKFAASRFTRAAQQAWSRSNFMALSQNAVINIGRITALLLAAKYWVAGEFTAGDVLFVMMNQRVLADYLDGIGNRLHEVMESVNDLEEVVTWHSRRPKIENHATIVTNDMSRFSLKVDNLSFAYAGQGRNAVSDFSLEVHPGEKVALVGKTGSGKSTVFKLLHRYYHPQQGTITIDGHDIEQSDLPQLRRQLALVSQEPVLFHRSLAENIAYSKPDATPDEIRRAAEMAQIADLIESLPKKYETLVGERGVKLSGGERQRVAIARAILADAKIILLDEATSSLDNETEKKVQKALHELTHGRSVLAIAHRISTIQEYDRIVVMDQGRIVESGTHDELLAKKGHYARLYNAHHGGFLSS